MKLFFLSISLCIIQLHIANGQGNSSILKNFDVHTIRTINSIDEDYSDLQPLKEILKDKRIVLLGEQSHGEGASFEAKVRLIKFLHKELGFDMLSFESGFYDNYVAYQKLDKNNYQNSPLKESIYSMWSDSREFEPLLQYIHHHSESTNPLFVSGFDNQESVFFSEEYLKDIKKELGKNLTLSSEDFTALEQVILGGPEFITTYQDDSIKFFSAADKLSKSFKKTILTNNSVKIKMLRQAFISWFELIKYGIDQMNEKEIKVQNPRDLQMAHNLIYLANLYPERKIIAWGASYHFANKIELYKNTDLTKQFISRLDSMNKSHDPTDLDKEIDGAIPMGRLLKDYFGTDIYSLAFSSYDGDFGILGSEPTPLKPIQPPKGSIEYELIKNKIAFVDYNNKNINTSFYSSALANLPVLAPWHKIFDGLFFIKTSFPPSFPEIDESDNYSSNTVAQSKKLNGNNQIRKLVDKKTKEPIGYANIYLLNTSKGVASNLNGEFIFNIENPNINNKVVLSSIGYESDTLSIEEFKTKSQIELSPKQHLLAELVIRSKPLTAKEIIKKAEKKVRDNYYPSSFEQEVFYRVSNYVEDSLEFNEEASVLVYNPDGYKPNVNAYRKLKSQILQFRNTTLNSSKEIWEGTGSLWKMYSHDLILDKANVLHRPNYYNLTLVGISVFEDRKIYEISYICKKPGSYTTGYGYPAPSSANGSIFIDVDNFSVLKVETLITRKPYIFKKSPHLTMNPRGHQLIQIYKEFEGKYFLNYSKQVHFSKWTNSKTNKSHKHVSISELLSTEIITEPKKIPTSTLLKIKSAKVKQDLDFWKTHNIVIEDNIDELLKLFDLPIEQY